MIWFFKRGQDVVRLETRMEPVTAEYVLTIIWADNRETIERYQTVDAFTKRLLILETQLANERWSQSDSPKILLEPWRRPQ
jgi:hypothetical protein